MATTNWWRVATNPNHLTDDELHAIMDADHLILSLAPSSPDVIPKTVTFCQVIGVMQRVWKMSPLRYSYTLQWINVDEAVDEEVDWNAFGRDHARNLSMLRRATAIARLPFLTGSTQGIQSPRHAGQLTEDLRRRLHGETYSFFRLHRHFFHHPETDIYVVQVFEKHAWGIRFLVRGRVNGVRRTLISVPALAHLALDLTSIVSPIKRSRSMLEVNEY